MTETPSELRMRAVKNSVNYRAIQEHYEDRVAERSRVPLIQHIDEGLVVLNEINASLDAMCAYCLHPLFQADADLVKGIEHPKLNIFTHREIALVMEYRYRANAWLSDMVITLPPGGGGPGGVVASGLPNPGDVEDVWHMLIADKVQNYKDFLKHHLGTHKRSAELTLYFEHWLLALDVSGEEFSKLCAAIDAARAKP
jgi:hypothetical protein